MRGGGYIVAGGVGALLAVGASAFFGGGPEDCPAVYETFTENGQPVSGQVMGEAILHLVTMTEQGTAPIIDGPLWLIDERVARADELFCERPSGMFPTPEGLAVIVDMQRHQQPQQ